MFQQELWETSVVTRVIRNRWRGYWARKEKKEKEEKHTDNGNMKSKKWKWKSELYLSETRSPARYLPSDQEPPSLRNFYSLNQW